MHKELQVTQVLKVHKVLNHQYLEILELVVQLEGKVLKVVQVHKVQQVVRVHKDFKVIREHRGLVQALKELQVLQVEQALREQLKGL